VRESHERDDVELDLAQLAVEVERVERAERAEARVVDEQLDGRGVVAAARFHTFQLRRVGEVGRQHFDVRAVGGLELLGERVEATLVASDEHDVVPAFGEEPGERFADSRGRSGDKGDRSIHAVLPAGFGRELTSLPFTTIRSAALCLGWHANSVIVGVVVG